MRRFTVTALIPRRWRRIALAATGLAVGTATVAVASPETRCQGSRYDVAGTYARCQLKATGKYLAAGSVDVPKYQERAGKCAEVYSRMLVRLQGRAKGTGSTCDGAQLVDNGDGTVTDRLTGLQWEQKTDDGSVHDKDDRYSWSGAGGLANGTVFTSFLPALNGACFAGHCDWRLPTLTELQTILTGQYPQGGVDQVLGPLGDYYWSTSTEPGMPDLAWVLSFQDGSRATAAKDGTFNVRAVRGSL
jgi:hypothetical protein